MLMIITTSCKLTHARNLAFHTIIIIVIYILCNIIILFYIYVGLYTGVLPMRSTTTPVYLTVVLVTRYVAIPHQPAVEVRDL